MSVQGIGNHAAHQLPQEMRGIQKSKSLFLLLFSKMIPISHRNNPDCRNMTNISPARSVSLSAFISSPMMMRATPSLSLMTL